MEIEIEQSVDCPACSASAESQLPCLRPSRYGNEFFCRACGLRFNRCEFVRGHDVTLETIHAMATARVPGITLAQASLPDWELRWVLALVPTSDAPGPTSSIEAPVLRTITLSFGGAR